METCQEKRSSSFREAKKCMEKISVLMESIDNMNAVQSHLYKFIQCNDEADKAALVERMAALKRKHLLEAKDEELKREKEQLALETELAEANAKLGMNSS